MKPHPNPTLDQKRYHSPVVLEEKDPNAPSLPGGRGQAHKRQDIQARTDRGQPAAMDLREGTYHFGSALGCEIEFVGNNRAEVTVYDRLESKDPKWPTMDGVMTVLRTVLMDGEKALTVIRAQHTLPRDRRLTFEVIVDPEADSPAVAQCQGCDQRDQELASVKAENISLKEDLSQAAEELRQI